MSDETDELIQPEIVTDPGAFGPGSHTPATEAPILSLKDRLRQNPDVQRVGAEIQGIRKARTRSPRKPKEEVDSGKTLADLQKERKTKKERSDQIAQQITGEFNDMVLRFFVSQGVPAEALYNRGYVPPPVSRNAGRYTEAGAKIAVDDFTASMVASFVVEFESSDLGGQLVSKATGGPVGLVVKGLVAGACVVGYLNGLKQVAERLQPLIAANKQYQASKNRQDQRQQEQKPTYPEGPLNGI